jgi:hypothetical protein
MDISKLIYWIPQASHGHSLGIPPGIPPAYRRHPRASPGHPPDIPQTFLGYPPGILRASPGHPPGIPRASPGHPPGIPRDFTTSWLHQKCKQSFIHSFSVPIKCYRRDVLNNKLGAETAFSFLLIYNARKNFLSFQLIESARWGSTFQTNIQTLPKHQIWFTSTKICQQEVRKKCF